MLAMAEQLTGAELVRGIEVFSRRSVEHGARPWAERCTGAVVASGLSRDRDRAVGAGRRRRPLLWRGDQRIPVTL